MDKVNGSFSRRPFDGPLFRNTFASMVQELTMVIHNVQRTRIGSAEYRLFQHLELVKKAFFGIIVNYQTKYILDCV